MKLKLDNKGLTLINSISDLALKGCGLNAIETINELTKYIKENIEKEEEEVEIQEAE